MQKYFLLFSILLIIHVRNQAQSSFGAIGGLSIANLTNLEDDLGGGTVNFKVGIRIGAIFKIAIDSQLSLQPEICYSEMGSNIKSPSPIGNIGIDLNLNYISIPILLKYNFGAKPVKFFLELGPRIGFGIGDITLKSGNDSESYSWEEAEFKKFDYGIELGAGISFPVGIASMFFDARYYFGLQKLNSGNSEGNAQNTAIGINAGYLFPIGRSK